MSKSGVSESHFHMWRAVFAMAHVDGRLRSEEIDFIINYMEHVPFSERQESIIENDIQEPKEVGDMLSKVTEPEDRSQFFQFATRMAQCDKEFAVSEQIEIECHLAAQMSKFDLQDMEADLSAFRKNLEAQRKADLEQFERDAEEKVGLGVIIKELFSL